MNKMNPQIKARWIEALRSGHYKQGSGSLRLISDEGSESFCCLGVLCDLHAEAEGEGWRARRGCGFMEYGGHANFPPVAVYDWAGLCLDTSLEIDGVQDAIEFHNDGGRSFAQIADAIEAQL